MSDNISLLPTPQQMVEDLDNLWETMVSPSFRSALRHITPREAAALRRGVLRLVALLDDSVSNPNLGSIFDRSSSSPLKKMLEQIATLYGVLDTVAGTTGTSALNAAAVMALALEGERIGIARDSHVSVIGALSLSGAQPVYLVPSFHSDLGVLLPPSRRQVAQLLEANPEVKSIVLTMPTYHGLMGDIRGIVEECHERNVLVMVDAAHGPHFHFLRTLGFPVAAEDAGADIVTQSTHKVLSALNQASLAHFNNRDLLRRYEEHQSRGFQSTSFSYPILLSIEHAVQQIYEDGNRMWGEAARQARRLRDGAARLPGVRVLDESIVDGKYVTGLDPTRVTLNVRDTGLSGHEISSRLHDRKLIAEMATPDVVLFLISPSVSPTLVDAILDALKDALQDIGSVRPINAVFQPPALPEQRLTPREAMLEPRKRVPKAEAVGRISGEMIGCYPPGQAILVAGEQITQEAVDHLDLAVKAGGHLKRIQDDDFQTIEVVCTAEERE